MYSTAAHDRFNMVEPILSDNTKLQPVLSGLSDTCNSHEQDLEIAIVQLPTPGRDNFVGIETLNPKA